MQNSLFQKSTARVNPPVREAVAAGLASDTIKAYLTSVYRGELETVEDLLKVHPSLVYAQDSLTDLSERAFPQITGFQYAVWALDAPMWTLILKYLPLAEANAQIDAYSMRQDLIQAYGAHYNVQALLMQYDDYIEGCAQRSMKDRHHKWATGVGAQQAKIPAWLAYAMTEPTKSAAWTQKEVDFSYLRVVSDEFKNFYTAIGLGTPFFRGREMDKAYAAHGRGGSAWKLLQIGHDRQRMSIFYANSYAQRRELNLLLSQSLESESTGRAPNRP